MIGKFYFLYDYVYPFFGSDTYKNAKGKLYVSF